MGCACVKSDVVVKNQKMSNRSSEISNKKDQVRQNSNNENMVIRNFNENIMVNNHNSNSNNLRGSSINQMRSSSNPRNQSPIHARNVVANIQANTLQNNNIIQGSMPYLAGLHDPDFNFPEICI
jgi:hypothetical protein